MRNWKVTKYLQQLQRDELDCLKEEKLVKCTVDYHVEEIDVSDYVENLEVSHGVVPFLYKCTADQGPIREPRLTRTERSFLATYGDIFRVKYSRRRGVRGVNKNGQKVYLRWSKQRQKESYKLPKIQVERGWIG